jgi:hypothetical protein
MKHLKSFDGLDDWSIVCQLLPDGWTEAAQETGALARSRRIKNAETLLRVLLIHLAGGCSLVETSSRAKQAGYCSISSVGLFKRLRSSEQWLRWLAERLWTQAGHPLFKTQYRVRAVDATTVQEPGSTGTDWRVHYVLDLSNLQCDHFELTDVKGGETFRRIPVQPNDLLLGDRAYGTPPGVAHVTERKGRVLVRINHRSLPLYLQNGTRAPLLSWLKKLKVGAVQDWPTWVYHEGTWIRGRVVAIKRGRIAARHARAQLKQTALKKQKTLSKQAIFAAGYVFMWTTVPARVMTARQILELYRTRWQIELAFKRMKSIMGLGHLPKTSDSSATAWIHGKLLTAMLIERLLQAAEDFSPWGYRVCQETESLA